MSDDGWITESVVQFTRSPLWQTPVNNFIDDNCWLFDEGEMLVEQTEVHMSFRKLIDDLLTDFVGDIGVSLEVVFKEVEKTICDSSETQTPADTFLSYIFYVDDFCTFHKMMSKRNIELNIWASRELQKRERGATDADAAMTSEQEKELKEADAMQMAIEASLNDELIWRKELELEDLQIQEALALSISAENERIRRAAAAISEEISSCPEQDDSASIEQAQKEKLTALEEERTQNIMKLEARALEVRQEALLRGITATHVVDPTNVSPSPEKAPPQEKKPIAPTKVPEASTAPKIHIAPPLPGLGKLYGLKPLPSIQPSFKQLEAMTTNAVKGTLESETTKAHVDSRDPAAEEMEARARYMREQREKIIAQNKAKRNKELNEYSAKKASNPQQSELQKEEKQMTVDLARRLREDIVREATK